MKRHEGVKIREQLRGTLLWNPAMVTGGTGPDELRDGGRTPWWMHGGAFGSIPPRGGIRTPVGRCGRGEIGAVIRLSRVLSSALYFDFSLPVAQGSRIFFQAGQRIHARWSPVRYSARRAWPPCIPCSTRVFVPSCVSFLAAGRLGIKSGRRKRTCDPRCSAQRPNGPAAAYPILGVLRRLETHRR